MKNQGVGYGVLKSTLIQALSGDKRGIDKLCREYYSIALAYLKTKVKSENHILNLLYTSLEDFAWDCIADLFENEERNLTQLSNYFDGIDTEQVKESEIFSLSRKLVFSKVNEGIYRNYKKFDPSLSKIIRNLKRTLAENKVEGASYNNGSRNIEIEPLTKGKILLPEELLEIWLGKNTSSIENSVDAIERLSAILKRNPEYANRYPLVAYAVLLRKVFAWQLNAEETEDHTLNRENYYKQEELVLFLKKAIKNNRNDFYQAYVDSGKMTEGRLNKYLEVSESILKSDYIEAQTAETYYDHFKQVHPEVSYEKYRHHYRMILEYMVKKIRDDLVYILKKEIKYSAAAVDGNDRKESQNEE